MCIHSKDCTCAEEYIWSLISEVLTELMIAAFTIFLMLLVNNRHFLISNSFLGFFKGCLRGKKSRMEEQSETRSTFREHKNLETN